MGKAGSSMYVDTCSFIGLELTSHPLTRALQLSSIAFFNRELRPSGAEALCASLSSEERWGFARLVSLGRKERDTRTKRCGKRATSPRSQHSCVNPERHS